MLLVLTLHLLTIDSYDPNPNKRARDITPASNPMRIPFRRRTNSSPKQQARPPPGPQRNRKSPNIQRAASSTAYLSSSPQLSSSFEFNDARQRWSELARDRRSGLSLSLASDDLEPAASIDSISIGDPPATYPATVRHVCTPPPFVEYSSSTGAIIAPSNATTDSVNSNNSSAVPSANPSPTSVPHPHPPRSAPVNVNPPPSRQNSNQNQSSQQLHFHPSTNFYPQHPNNAQQNNQSTDGASNASGSAAASNTNINVEVNTNNSGSTPTSSPILNRQSFSEYSPNPSLGFRVDYAELTALKQKFNQLDAEGKGFLSRAQFYELFSTFMNSSQHDGRDTSMFNFAYSLFQSAGDQLNLREFVTGMSILSKGSEEERLRYLFMMYDKDNSGNLNAVELKQVFRVMGSYAASHDFRASDSLDSQSLSALRTINPSVLDDLVEKTVRQYDLDGDGTIGFDDFVKWCQSNPVVKTWMDMLGYETARGIARLRGESEKLLIAKELEGLGIGTNEFLGENFALQNSDAGGNPLSAPPPGTVSGPASASTNILPPTISSASQPNFSLPDRSDSSGEYPSATKSSRRRSTIGLNENGDGRSANRGNGNNNHSPPPGESLDAISGDLDRQQSERRKNDLEAIGSFEIPFKDLIFEKQIGSGSFAVVWRCKWLDSPVAVKVFKSGPRLILNSDGTPALNETVSQVSSASSEQSRRGGASTSTAHLQAPDQQSPHQNHYQQQHNGFVENDESFEPEFDSMMSARNAGGVHSSVNEEAGSDAMRHQDRFLQEISLLKSIRHPNLLLYMGACVDASYPLCIVSELIDGGSLFELLHGDPEDRVELTNKQKLTLTQDIARGMLYLHGRDPIVLHRDLKSANILVEPQNDDSYKGTIIDFGLSKFSSTQATIIPAGGRGLTGSLVTMAPEVMNGLKYEPRSDVYSYAIVCWEIWCGRVPFGRITAPAQLLMKVAIQGGRPEFEAQDNVPTTIQKLIRACWDQDIRKRPDFLMIVKTLNDIRHELQVDK